MSWDTYELKQSAWDKLRAAGVTYRQWCFDRIEVGSGRVPDFAAMVKRETGRDVALTIEDLDYAGRDLTHRIKPHAFNLGT